MPTIPADRTPDTPSSTTALIERARANPYRRRAIAAEIADRHHRLHENVANSLMLQFGMTGEAQARNILGLVETVADRLIRDLIDEDPGALVAMGSWPMQLRGACLQELTGRAHARCEQSALLRAS